MKEDVLFDQCRATEAPPSGYPWPPHHTKEDWSDVAVERVAFLHMPEVPGSKPGPYFRGFPLIRGVFMVVP